MYASLEEKSIGLFRTVIFQPDEQRRASKP